MTPATSAPPPDETGPTDAADPTDATDPTGPTGDAAPEPAPAPPTGHRNEVVLTGRVSAAPEERTLPSGDTLVTFRVVVDRPPEKGSTRRAVDVLDVACWPARVRRSALRMAPGDLVLVEGSLRRRFFAAGGGRASRYEVEARRAVRQT